MALYSVSYSQASHGKWQRIKTCWKTKIGTGEGLKPEIPGAKVCKCFKECR